MRPFVTPFHSVPPLKPSHDRNSPTDVRVRPSDIQSEVDISFASMGIGIAPSLPPPLPFSPLHCLRSISRHQRRSVGRQIAATKCPLAPTRPRKIGVEVAAGIAVQNEITDLSLSRSFLPHRVTCMLCPLRVSVPHSFPAFLSARPDAPHRIAGAAAHGPPYCMSFDRLARSRHACHFLLPLINF